MPHNRPTLEEIAKVAGVSRSTVSRVINDEPNVRPAVRQRVWEVVETMGYHPNAAARSLASRRSQVIGAIIPQTVNTVFADPFFPGVLRGIADAANEHKYHLMLSMVSPPLEEDFYRRALRSQLLDGVVIMSAFLDDPLIPRLLRDRIPFVIIGRHPRESAASYVDADNVRGARMATAHLLRQGRQRMASITGPASMIAGLDRREGYRTALREADLPLEEKLIVAGDFTEASGYAAMQQLLPQEPDAVFVANDLMAVGALRAIRQAGRRVPEDVALVGFDDAQIAAYAEPPLTTVRQPVYELGSTAIDLLLRLLENDTQGPLRTILPTELVIRASCGAQRRSA
ncbi:MAG: LacI family DNA-binding transcriptional regulator [Anaerolineae bacterium]